MGFLDNSGDIILDAVLTDLGRKLLSEGNGNFNITYFALGDEEINYKLYNPLHPSGSAYYDLEIIQTPILESFTNNASSMKTTLMTFDNDDILYLPVLKLNTNSNNGGQIHTTENIHLVAVDKNTQGNNDGSIADLTSIGGNGQTAGVLFGYPGDQNAGGKIVIDQGVDNEEYVIPLTEDNLAETAYIVQIDGKFGSIVGIDGAAIGSVTTDDDQIKYYTLQMDVDPTAVSQALSPSPIAGSKGTKLSFKIKASDVLTQNYSYFERYGFVKDIDGYSGYTNSTSCIDTIIRVTGVTYGSSIDIPVRFVKHS